MRLVLLTILATPAPLMMSAEAEADCGGGGGGILDFCGEGAEADCASAVAQAEAACTDETHYYVSGESDCTNVGLCYIAAGTCVRIISDGPRRPAWYAPPNPGPIGDCVCGTECRPEC